MGGDSKQRSIIKTSIKPIKKRDGTLFFNDFPQFQPNLSPKQMFQMGVFGGTYWRPIKSSVTGKSYKNQHKEFPKEWWKGLDEKTMLTSSSCNPKLNKFGVKSGTSLHYWESKGWIKVQDPYGWVQWYCRFYMGRRSPDDERQIERWKRFAGPKGRFRVRLENMVKEKNKKMGDATVSPVIRQGLLHWGFLLKN